MAIAATHLTSSETEIGATSFNTSSVTPTANRLQLLTVGSRIPAGDPAAPTVSGCNLTWVQVSTQQDPLTGAHHENRTTVFRALGASPSNGALTISFGAVSQTNCGWSLAEFSGTDTTGTNGSGAVVQSATNNWTTSPTAPALAAFGSANNATYCGIWDATGGSPTLTAGASLTVIGQGDGSTSCVGSEFQATNNTNPAWTCSQSGNGATIGIEIKAAVSTVTAGALLMASLALS